MTEPKPPANPVGEPVPPEETGYAVGEGQLRVDEDRDRFEIDLTAEEFHVLREAVRWDDEITDSIVETVPSNIPTQMGMKGSTFRGDLPALEQAIEALRRYEQYGAAMLEDKMAYDTRTALNHAESALVDLMEE